MEVAAADHVGVPVVADEDDRVVRDREDLPLEGRPREGQGVPRRAVHLRHAPERVRVLHFVTVGVALRDLRVRQERAQVVRALGLPRMRAHALDPRVERARRALQRLEAHRAHDVGQRREALRLHDGEPPDRHHHLRAVDQREPLLRSEGEGRQAALVQRLRARQQRAVHVRLALADEHRRQMRERREVPARPDRALTRDARDHVGVEEGDERFDDLRTNPGATERQGLRPEPDHRPHGRGRERRPHPAGMTEHEVSLERPHLLRRHPRLRQGAEPRVDPVDVRRLVPGRGEPGDESGRRLDPFAGRVGQRNPLFAPPDGVEIVEAEGAAERDGGPLAHEAPEVRARPRRGQQGAATVRCATKVTPSPKPGTITEVAEEEPKPGDWVKVKGDCPHTLPSYARMMSGQVLGPTEDGALEVQFGEGRVFPIEAKWLTPAPGPESEEG